MQGNKRKKKKESEDISILKNFAMEGREEREREEWSIPIWRSERKKKGGDGNGDAHSIFGRKGAVHATQKVY